MAGGDFQRTSSYEKQAVAGAILMMRSPSSTLSCCRAPIEKNERILFEHRQGARGGLDGQEEGGGQGLPSAQQRRVISKDGETATDCLQKHGLVAVSAFANATHTFYSGHGGGKACSWIDCVCVSRGLLDRMLWWHTLDKEGDALQLTDAQERRDHRPVGCCSRCGK